jgi:hypothetical protein
MIAITKSVIFDFSVSCIEKSATDMLLEKGKIVKQNYLRVVDALDGVIAHGEEEAAAELRPHRGRIEHGGGRVREQLLRHHVVRLDGRFNVLAVNAYGHLEIIRNVSTDMFGHVWYTFTLLF